MADPVILWRESYGYGALTFNQVYVTCGRSTNSAYGLAVPGDPGALSQWGRGSGADEGFALVGGNAGVRATSLGFAGAIDTSINKIGCAFAFNQGGRLGGSFMYELYDDDGAGNGTFDRTLLHLSVLTLVDGRIAVLNGTGSGGGALGTVIGISTFVMPVGLNGANGNFTHIEVVPAPGHDLIHLTNGGVRVYANGTLVLDLQGVSTRNALLGSGKVGYVQACAGHYANGSSPCISTDLVIHDCSGTGLIGDCRVSYQPAITLGTFTAGTPVGDTPIKNCVDEQAADGDTTYIDFDDTGLPKAASFVCKAMPANTVTIKDVTPLVVVRKSDASANTGRTLFKSGATTVDGGVDVATPTGYSLSTQVGPVVPHQTDPNTAAAWTIVNCDAVEVGYRRIA
jgi:hypothetical protein